MRGRLVKKIRPLFPIFVGLFVGVSISVFQSPLLNRDCADLNSQFDIGISFNHGQQKEIKYSQEQINKMGYKPMSPDEAERYRKDRVYAPPIQDNIEDFEPRIIMDPELKPKVAENYEKNKKIHRPRYLKQELGIRDNLVVAVVTSKSTLPTMGIAFNRTFSHHMQSQPTFYQPWIDTNIGGDNYDDTMVRNMNVKTLRAGSKNKFIVELLNNLHQEHIDTHDWFYLTVDTSYSQADRMNGLVNHVSINRRMYMGRPKTYTDARGIKYQYCSLKHGIVISRLLLIDIQPYLKQCSEQAESQHLSPDMMLGRCIKISTRGAVDCTDNQDGRTYYTFDLPDDNSIDIDSNDVSTAFKNSLVVTNVKSPNKMYHLHKRFSEIKADLAFQQISEIQEEIKSLEGKLPPEAPALSWPIGINPSYRPTNRWDIILWDYFTEDYTLTCPGEIPKCELNGIDKIDIVNIIEVALKRLNEKYNPQGLQLSKKKLINGYRRFDPQRGMEYILDLLLYVQVQGRTIEVNHRVDLLRPLTNAEIVPMPFVTESASINIILSVTKHERNLFKKFMNIYASVVLQTKEKCSLTVVFIYNGESASQLKDNDIFLEQKKILDEFEDKYKNENDPSKLIPWLSIKTEIPSQLKTMDIETKKFSDDALLYITSPAADLNSDFLNRCRMNTLQGWQAFFPIPFSRYNPEIVHKGQPAPEKVSIKPKYGRFDIYSFDEVCIHNSDYVKARNLLSASVSQHDTQLKITEAQDKLNIYDLLVKYSQLHVFRAVEPQLVRRYYHRACDTRSGDDSYHRCIRSNSEGLASRQQLGLELFPED